MGIYASQPGRFVGQVVGDAFVLGWTLLWAVVGFFVDQSIAVLAGPARETARSAQKLSADFSDAATQAAQVPGLGDQLRRPFDSAAETLGSVVGSANQQVESIERVALLVGWLAFLIPVTIVLALWVPRRVRFYRRARSAQRFIDSQADLDLFALRAMATQPMHVLAAVSPDPVRAWRSGDRQVIDALAEIELRKTGLKMPTRS